MRSERGKGQQGPVAEMADEAAEGGADAVGDGALEEAPQAGGGQAEASDFVGEPDGERPPAAGSCVAVAAKDPPGAERLVPEVVLVIAEQTAVANESADHLAVRTRGLLEPLGKGVEFLVVAVKPALLAHLISSAQMVIIPERG